jgi:hypothetical protein
MASDEHDHPTNGAVCCHDEAPDASAEHELSPPPAEVAELTASCVRFVLAKYGVLLDGTSDTLSLLDQYVHDAREAVGAQPASVPLLEAAVGAYFGEVLRRAFDASWSVGDRHDAWRLDFHNVFLTLNPIGVAHEALALEESEGWHAHIEVDPAEKDEVEARMARLPEVPVEQFYAPSTRFDVIEIAVETLRARALAAGLSSVRFTAADYRRS